MPKVIENFLSNCPTYDELDKMLCENGCFDELMWIMTPDERTKKYGCFLGVEDEHGSLPYLRCPSFIESKKVSSRVKSRILDPVNDKLGSRLNLLKVQKYVNGVCGISSHSDKLLDLTPGTSIYIFRVNKSDTRTRSLYFRNKDDESDVISFDLKSNSLLEITYDENKKYVHYVPVSEKDATDECISFVLRECHTFMHPETKIKYGGGAKYKTYEERVNGAEEPLDMRDEQIKEDIVNMYRFENTYNLFTHDCQSLFDIVMSKTY